MTAGNGDVSGRPRPGSLPADVQPGSGLGPGPEFDLIRGFLQRSSAPRPAGELVGPGDDCAVVTGAGIALSSDMSVEGVHFRREWLTPEEIGWRAASAALSDLAAVAARPIGLLVSCAITERDAGELATGLMDGVRSAAEAVGGVVLGGDLTRSTGPIVLDVTVVGETARPVLRSGARTGDEVWVTGELGGAAYAVEALLRGAEPSPGARRRLAHPLPRIREALWLAEKLRPTSLIDLSDGLAGDAAHLARASDAALVLEKERVPVDPALQALGEPDVALRFALTGGEDYELCFTVSPGRLIDAENEFQRMFGIRLTRVGRVEDGAGVHVREAGGGRVPLAISSFQHFRGES